MRALSAVTLLMAENTSHLELAREVFTSETRRFVSDVLEAARRERSDPWTNGRVKIELPREISTEPKISAYVRNQYCLARAELRFKRDARYIMVAEVPFGIAYDERVKTFTWQVNLSPLGKYPRLDDVVWKEYQSSGRSGPEAIHHHASNTVCFVSRQLSNELSGEAAYADAKAALEFLLGLAGPIEEVVRLDLAGADPETDVAN